MAFRKTYVMVKGNPRRVDLLHLAQLLTHLAERLARYRAHQMLIENVLSRLPALRRLLRRFPRNLKTRHPYLVPFRPECWSRGKVRPRGRIHAAVEYLRHHPRAKAPRAAQRYGISYEGLLRSEDYKDLRLEQGYHAGQKLRDLPAGRPGDRRGRRRSGRSVRR